VVHSTDPGLRQTVLKFPAFGLLFQKSFFCFPRVTSRFDIFSQIESLPSGLWTGSYYVDFSSVGTLGKGAVFRLRLNSFVAILRGACFSLYLQGSVGVPLIPPEKVGRWLHSFPPRFPTASARPLLGPCLQYSVSPVRPGKCHAPLLSCEVPFGFPVSPFSDRSFEPSP